MTVFQRKLYEVTAEQFFPDQKPWPVGVEQSYTDQWSLTGQYVRVFPSDWVVTDEDGLSYSISDVNFRRKYEQMIP